MSENPIGVLGQPSACAIGFGMAITTGVCMNETPGVGTYVDLPATARRWLSTAPHVFAAGDQITGRGPFDAGLGQPVSSSFSPAPDDTFATFTVMHLPLTVAPESLNCLPRPVSSTSFSGDDAMLTVTQLSAAAGEAATLPTHASAIPAVSAAASARFATRRLRIRR